MNEHLHPVFRDILNSIAGQTAQWPFPKTASEFGRAGADQAIAKDDRAQAKAELEELLRNAPEASL